MRTLTISLTLIALASCRMVGPNYPGAPGLEREGNFANAPNTLPAIDKWWKRLGDSGLNRLVEGSLAGNLDLRLARERLQEARALRKQAAAAFLPQGTGTASLSRIDFGGGGLAGGLGQAGLISDPLEFWRAGVDVSWEVDVFGGRRREARAATARVEAAREALHAARLAIVSETVEAYYTMAGLEAQLAEVNRQVRGLASQHADMQSREQAGAASKLEVDRARARLETTRSQAPSLQAGIASQQRRLMILLGTPRSTIDRRISGASRLLPRKLPMIRTGLRADLVTRRPDIRMAERELAAATEDIGVATANFYPRFSLLGGPSVSRESFGDLFDAAGFDWQIGPGVSWSLFSGGRNRAILAAANSRQKQALTRYEKAVISAIQEVEAELIALQSETRRLAIVQRARQATAQSVKRVREIEKAGAIDRIDVLVEEERLRQAEIAEVRVKSQLILVWTRFHKALGGGWK